MAQYISKSAVVAGIERLKKKCIESVNFHDFRTQYAFESVLSLLKTLEVIEVDLEDEYARQNPIRR